MSSLAAEKPVKDAPAPPASHSSTSLFPEHDLKPGMRGQVRTVLRGSERQSIDVEIIGVLDDGIAPGIDLVLARLLGEVGNWNGVAAGMSGSPVYIDGKLVGALSYSIGQFAKEPVLGITPIGQMLALKDYPGGILPWSGAPVASGDFSPAPLALVAPGVPSGTLDQVDDLIGRLHLARTSSTVSASAPAQEPASPSLEPGDPVSALLVWGDVKLGATGTVTWREGDQLLAFGHPFLASGRAEMPLAGGEILWTVPSLYNSFKIARIGNPVGTLRQDRLTGIAGQIGPVPVGLPVTVTVRRSGRPEVTKHYQVARDPFLSPILAALTFRMTLLQAVGNERDESVRMIGHLRLAGGKDIRFTSGAVPGGFTGSRDQQLGVELMQRVTDLVRPPVPLPQIESLDLTIESSEPDAVWEVRRALPDRLAARPGDRLRVMVDLENSRGGQRREILDLAIPQGEKPGSYLLLAGSERALAGEFGNLDEARRRTARTADDYLAAISSLSADDRLQVTLARPAEGLVSEGQEYPALPGSAHVLMRSRPGGVELYRARWQPQASAARDLDRTITDTARVSIEILPPESTR